MTASHIAVSATPQDGDKDTLSVDIALPATVNVDDVRAKFSKKRKKLTVRAPTV